MSSRLLKDFYLDSYAFVALSVAFSAFEQVTTGTNISTGYLRDITTPGPSAIKKLGSSTFSNLRFIVPGSMLKFIPPAGKLFLAENNELVDQAVAPVSAKDSIWCKVVNVIGDGTAQGTGLLTNNQGPVILNQQVPTGAIADTVVPKFVGGLEDSVKNKVIDLIFSNKNFALRYDTSTTSWKIVNESNIDKRSPFSLGKTGEQSNQQLDASWIVLFETDGESYSVTYRALRYVFESEKEMRFFFDSSDKVYDQSTGKVVRDKILVMGINTKPDSLQPFNQNFEWEIVNEYLGTDGYIDTKKISISFYDSDEDGVVDDPEIFKKIIEPSVNTLTKFVFQKRQTSLDGVTDYYYFDNTNGTIKVYTTQDQVPLTLNDGQLVYIIRENLVKIFKKSSTTFTITNEYRGYFGRGNIKFQYVHSADSNARLDPAATNIVDIFMLTKTYDVNFRRWLSGEVKTKPLPLSSDALYTSFGEDLDKVKAISDEIIYHPAKYKPLFGSLAPISLQATFKVVKASGIVVSDNDIKAGVITAINEFFAIENWDFGDTFYFGELAAYVIKKLTPNLVNLVIVPKQESLAFGSLFEVNSNADEILISCATVDDIEIISEITAARINSTGTVLTSVPVQNNDITSS